MRQVIEYAMVILGKKSPKKNVNLNLPIPVHELYVRLTEPLGQRVKWSVISAAIVSLVELDELERDQRINEMLLADSRSKVAEVVARRLGAQTAGGGVKQIGKRGTLNGKDNRPRTSGEETSAAGKPPKT